MPDIILKALTPLGHDAPETETVGPFTITERIDVALASVATRRGRQTDVATAAAGAGIPLPGPGRAEMATLGAFWLSPDQWMIEAPFANHENIRAFLLPLFGDAASITEQTDAWVRFDLSAPDLTSLMERLTNFDLATAMDGAATRTVIDHLGCYLIKRSATLVTVYGPRSSAQNLYHAMIVAAKSIL